MRDSEELVRLIHNAMLAAGIDEEAVYRQLGCDSSLFANIGRRCPHEYQAAFWAAVERVTGDDEVALRICPYLPVFRGQALEYLLLSSPTLREGIQTARRYRRLISDAIELDIVEDEQGSRLVLQSTAYDAPQRRHTEICFVYGFMHTLHSVTQGVFAPSRIKLATEARRPQREYEQIFGCPIQLGEAMNEIWIDSALLDTPSTHGSSVMLEVHATCAARQLDCVETQDTVDHVRDVLTRRRQGVFTGLERNLEEVAAMRDMSPRGLRGALANADTSFRALKKQARMVIARQLLCETEMPVTQVAQLSGFSEATAFHRAFRDSTGHTPQAYRDQANTARTSK